MAELKTKLESMHIIGYPHDNIGIALAMELAKLHLHETVIIVDDFNHEEQKMKLQEQYGMKLEIQPLPVIEPYSKPECSPSKHHCFRKQMPRKNKMQKRSRRINRK
jgi:hypothetical protein